MIGAFKSADPKCGSCQWVAQKCTGSVQYRTERVLLRNRLYLTCPTSTSSPANLVPCYFPPQGEFRLSPPIATEKTRPGKSPSSAYFHSNPETWSSSSPVMSHSSSRISWTSSCNFGKIFELLHPLQQVCERLSLIKVTRRMNSCCNDGCSANFGKTSPLPQNLLRRTVRPRQP